MSCFVCLIGGSARADEATPDAATRIDVTVGEVVERDVGIAIGLRCDDLTIVHAELRTTTPASNTFVARGMREGTTRCRVGTTLYRPTYLFELHVVPAHPAP